MSRCTGCGNSFVENNAWEEFCCLACAKSYFGCTPTRTKNIKEFNKNLNNPKFSRRIRLNGTQAHKPSFGIFREVLIADERNILLGEKPKYRRVKMNVGGVISVRPMTATERAYAIKLRGRGGFSDCCNNTGLKSAGMGNMSNV